MKNKHMPDIPDEFVKRYYERYKERIFDACKQEYFRLRKNNVDLYELDAALPSPETVGRILAVMYLADDWKTVAMAWEICKSDGARESIYNKMWGNN